MPSLPAKEEVSTLDVDEAICSAKEAVSMYSECRIWKSSLLLIPLQIQYHWMIVAVTNLFDALSCDYLGPRMHDVLPGDLKPDYTPFSILLFNSGRSMKNSTFFEIFRCIRAFLESSWGEYRQTRLEFVDCFTVKVSCTNRMYSPLHQAHTHSFVVLTAGRALWQRSSCSTSWGTSYVAWHGRRNTQGSTGKCTFCILLLSPDR